jgi:MFS family permease
VSPAFLTFAVLLLAGFLGAAATGKLVPHARWLTESYGISLGLAGFAISAVMLPGAVLSAPLGVVTDRLGARAVAMTGLVTGALASMALGLAAGNFTVFLLLRLVEGVGYCLLAVGATVLVVDTTPDRYRTLALAVWSSFAPIGFALGQWASASAIGPDRLTGIGLWHGAMMLTLALFAWLVLPRPASAEVHGKRPSFLDAVRHPPALLSSLAFGCVTGILLAAVAVAPLVLARLHGMSVADAARLTALAALPGIAGRFGAGWLLGRKLTPAAVLLAAGMSGALAISLVLAAGLPLWPALVLFTVFQILMGLVPGVLSAMIPHVAPSRDRIGAVSGLVNQMVTLGNLLGPPLVLSVFAAADAIGAALMLAAWTALSVALVVRLPVFTRPVA